MLDIIIKGFALSVILLLMLLVLSRKYLICNTYEEQKEKEKYRLTYPFKLNEFIGNSKAVDELKIYISNHKNKHEHINHILFSSLTGGLGKTTLAEIISDELNMEMISTIGEKLQKPEDIIEFLSLAKKPSIMFIDEIHNVKSCETLYPVLQDNIIYHNGLRYNLPKLVFIGCTTKLSNIEKPFIQRFPIQLELLSYSLFEIANIIKTIAKVPITDSAIEKIYIASSGIPRIAKSILKTCQSICIYINKKIIDLQVLDFYFNLKGLDKTGLNQTQLKIMNLIRNGPLGLNILCNTLNTNKLLVQDNESVLLSKGFIKVSNKGRELTQLGRSYIDASTTKV